MELDGEDKASRDSFYGSSAARPAMLFDKHSKAVSRSERENAVNGLLGGTPGMLLLLLPLWSLWQDPILTFRAVLACAQHVRHSARNAPASRSSER